jgi:hypothetical protein
MTLRAPSANAAANLAWQATGNLLHQRTVVAGADRRVEVDELDHGILGKTFDPIIEVIELQFLLLALNQLHDLAAHKID